ncbi:uncharacterized protein LOC132620082 [Lycium barbarum]|uniref:uncharacterized protein LOC132620082 n=1 Tax=Lycium barbarum TaxID=112863 RepID=UPI00293EFB18|nr:uncharacterized protein LOC132620082 [Lycium barbarum]
MAIETTEIPASTGTTNTTASTDSTHILFHPDDYTHLCHPLYVHPSDLLASSLVSELFDGTFYGSWRRSILITLSFRNKLDFIHGTFERPAEGSPLLRQWQRCNDLVVAWLVNSVTKEIQRSVVYSEFAKDIWRELEDRYGKADGARVFELKKSLAHISQGSLDIASYFTKIKQLWDELASISIHSANKCNCIGGAKFEEEQRVYQFLMGLYEVYVQVRSNILMMKPLPSIDTTYSILLSDEKQRQVCTSSSIPSESESASFHVSSSSNGGPRPQFNPKANYDSQKSSLFCKYCKRSGHLMEKCHRLHGYPSHFKFTKSSGHKKAAANVACDSSPTTSPALVPFAECSDNRFGTSGLTKDEHAQLIHLMQKSHISPSSSHSLMASAHFAGRIATHSVFLKPALFS